MLFRTVELTDSASFYRFAAHFDTAPASPAMSGSSCSSAAPSTRYRRQRRRALRDNPQGPSPHLVFIDFWRIFEDETWHPDASRMPVAKELPYLPLHPRFPDLLAAFSGRITELDLVSMIFPSFGDLARVLHAVSVVDPATGPDARLDLSRFPNLHAAKLWLLRSLKEDPSLQTLCGDILRSWTPTVHHRELTIEPSFASDFTRQDFADLLAETGTTVERVFDDAAKISQQSPSNLVHIIPL
ncbi:hypothetical protein LXA43DRAFT_1046514 [Ganoderma leucocontextum]|nr:hypothetical protein LXA43DRAFT_1046514 [Ganoderma leucocontextum]